VYGPIWTAAVVRRESNRNMANGGKIPDRMPEARVVVKNRLEKTDIPGASQP
jgi:hypothetical protein